MSPKLAIHIEPPGPFNPGDWVCGRVDVLEGGNSRALHVPRSRRATKPTKASRERRLEQKRRASERKAARRRPDLG